ncbi:MAG: dTMP kinase [Elusimicrobia bacterium]|nr:dTMP kinase [Elusimicrobiota bacterium]
MRGRFIVLEGPDKSGKSTQAALLIRYLKARRIPVLHSREPGGSALSEGIRKLLLHPRYRVHPLAELLLYEAARAQHTEETLRPALARGQLVICERYTLATLAYQGFGRGLPMPMVRQLNHIATGGLKPDLTIVLDIPDSEFDSRPRLKHDRLESEGGDFRKKVRRAYHVLARRERGVLLLNGREEPQTLHASIVAKLARFLP